QDISPDHQGKVTGVASVAAWVFAPLAQWLFGRHIDRSGSFDLGLALSGAMPALAFALLYFGWGHDKKEPNPERDALVH
ncbi:MAG TPA: hypothetical protein VHH73_03100, partial [Verrucomicrobiae bacterium]|nr:hypothetical protein [Verrucomicrobiae bacterium]